MDIKRTLKKLPNLSQYKRYLAYEEMYLEYANNFLTLTKFAEYYDIDKSSSRSIIDMGKYINNNKDSFFTD